jgi:alpha/beta superfamily hydrolase
MTNATHFLETTAEHTQLPSPKGILDAVLTYPNAADPIGAVVIAGPHPLLGGDMNNNVVEAMSSSMPLEGLVTLRFNYAGVGGSGGPESMSEQNLAEFWQTGHTIDEGERWQDLDAAIHYLHDVMGHRTKIGLVAYSFGNFVTSSWLANVSESSTHAPLAWICCVAPTLEKHDMTALAKSACPKIVIAPRDDFAAPIANTTRILKSWKNVVETVVTSRDGHFFRGHEAWLCQTCFNLALPCMRTIEEI